MKAAGCTAILFSSLLFGLNMIYLKKKNIEEIKQIILFLSQLKTSLEFSLKSPLELFEDVRNNKNLSFIDRSLELFNKGWPLEDAFNYSIKEERFIQKSEKELLCALFSFFGLYDKQTQEKRFDFLIREFEQLLLRKEDELIKKERLYPIFTISIGIGAIIVLI